MGNGPRLSARGGNGRAHVAPEIFGDALEPSRKPLVDLRQLVTGLALMIPAAVVAVVVSYFAQRAEVQALTLENVRHEQAIRALEQADRERAIKDSETVARIEALVHRIDELLKRIERIEDKR